MAGFDRLDLVFSVLATWQILSGATQRVTRMMMQKIVLRSGVALDRSGVGSNRAALCVADEADQ